MAVLAISLVVFLAMSGYSSALYCMCNSGVAESALQKNIDYACGNGADCTQILQNGACYQPNNVKSHCDYAVNSYYQRKGQISGSCDFSSTASVVQTAPAGQSSTCVYPSSASSGTTPSTGGTTTPGGGTTGGNTGTGGTTGGTGTGTGTGGTTGGLNPTFGGGGGLGPSTGTGMNTDTSSPRLLHQSGNVFISFILPLLFSGFLWLKL